MDVLATPDRLQIGEHELRLSGEAVFESGLHEVFRTQLAWEYAHALGREREITFDRVVTDGTDFIYFKGTPPIGGVVARIPREVVFSSMEGVVPHYVKSLTVTDKGLGGLEKEIKDLGLDGLKTEISKPVDILHRNSPIGPPRLIIGFTDMYSVNIRY